MGEPTPDPSEPVGVDGQARQLFGGQGLPLIPKHDERLHESASAKGPRPADRRPPRLLGIIGTVLLGMLVASGFQFIGGCLAGAGVGFGLAFKVAMEGEEEPKDIEAALEAMVNSPKFMSLLIVTSSLGFLVTALWAGRRSALPRREQFGLNTPGVPWYGHFTFLLGTILMAAVGQLAAAPLSEYLPVFVDVTELRASISVGETVLFVLAISIGPGVAEEIFFRGYVLRRLLRRLRPVGAIVVSAVLFAIAHVDPLHTVFALPIGLWLGYVAWKTGSVWPGVACHSLFNGLWNLWFIGVEQGVISADVEMVTCPVVIGLGMLSVVGGALVLRRRVPCLPLGPSIFSQPAQVAVGVNAQCCSST